MEEFFKNYQYTFHALSAIATAISVIVALIFSYIASISNRPKIQASINSKININTNEEVLFVSIRNIGAFPIQINYGFLSFKYPFKKGGFWFPNMESHNQYPITITPNHAMNFTAPISNLKDRLRKENIFKRYFLKGVILISGRKVIVNLEKSFKKAIRGEGK